ncbi:MAG TPA: hypothetical protein VE153_21525 [Myxococcus sp.]|nr:hypothetical protein [Myxococcus sp.]
MRRKQSTRVEEDLDSLFRKADALMGRGRLQEAFRLFLRGAQAGEPSCQLNVGCLYDVGKGVRRSRERALYWYRKGARRREGPAANNIATLYRDEGRPRLAARWFEKAVAWGDYDALLELAKLYLGPLKDRSRARRALIRIQRHREQTSVHSQEEAAALLARAGGAISGRRGKGMSAPE